MVTRTRVPFSWDADDNPIMRPRPYCLHHLIITIIITHMGKGGTVATCLSGMTGLDDVLSNPTLWTRWFEDVSHSKATASFYHGRGGWGADSD